MTCGVLQQAQRTTSATASMNVMSMTTVVVTEYVVKRGVAKYVGCPKTLSANIMEENML